MGFTYWSFFVKIMHFQYNTKFYLEGLGLFYASGN